MEEVSQICQPAVTQVESGPGSFVKALRTYFHKVHKATTVFSKSGLNKKRIVQFGLACAYLHRTGVQVRGTTLFKRSEKMIQHLPRTHALLRRGLKVASITKAEVLIKELIKKEQKGANDIIKWKFPEF